MVDKENIERLDERDHLNLKEGVLWMGLTSTLSTTVNMDINCQNSHSLYSTTYTTENLFNTTLLFIELFPGPQATGIPQTLSDGRPYLNLTMSASYTGMLARAGFTTRVMDVGPRPAVRPNRNLLAPGSELLFVVSNGVVEETRNYNNGR
ncbi:hypothetical protein EV363DRAFT_1295628 [Boletus edulis]|nr:hypothetical protein EV363DRAFT_1295628 [Boletus edulis]